MKPILIALTLFALAAHSIGQVSDPTWKFSLKQPGEGWEKPDFDATSWKEGAGGFGEQGTPGARVGTVWSTKNIWLRRTVELEKVPEKPALYVHHDEGAEVYINGKQVATFEGFVSEYEVVPLDEAARAAIQAGRNLMAVHCSQTTGGQFIDVHLIDADNVPELPKPKRPEHPFKSELITEWGAKVTPENAWREYPRPALAREQWSNLNGNWDYAITDIAATRPSQWDGKILVPFAVESKLSGVQRLLHDDKALWYHRDLKAAAQAGQRVLLHFEACDYETQVWVNDREIGKHTGGNTPFKFDITEALTDGDDHLYVRFVDSTSGYQLRGKQTAHPGGIFYTQVSGIWGTVWTETVPDTHIDRLKVSTKIDGTVTVEIFGSAKDAETTIVASLADQEVARATGKGTLTFKIADPKLWSPDSPTLYDLAITSGADSVKSYVGVREVGRIKDADGNWRFTLNGEVFFHWGPLDQGWWPDGLLTPPSDAGMRWDVDYLKASGFNMIRKHIKVEPRRFYSYCDQVGMLVWQDHVAGFPNPKWTRLDPNPEDAAWPDEAHAQWMLELDRMITELESHPSIAVWVPFNEAWGQHRTVEVGKWTVARDPSRLVNIASGGNFWSVGDVVDHHEYPHPAFPFNLDTNGRFDDFIKVVGEFGGHGLPTPDHLWDNSSRNWGYGGLPKDAAEYKERYRESIRRLVSLKADGIAAGVYTQTTDVEGEINGLVTYDRKRIKIPAAELKKLHAPLTEGWSAKRANAWYDKIAWPVGANFVPSSAINQLEMWQAETFDPETIDRELGWAAGLGMNTMRVFLQAIAWREDREGFYKRVDQYLAIAEKHGIRTMFVLFDGVWQPNPKPGKQPEPRPGLHNSGWVQSPGRDYLDSPERQESLEPYVTGVISYHTYDKPERARELTEGLLKSGRPVFCTEYMARGNDSTFAGILPIFHEHKIAAYNWGFVNGRSQTIYPWDSWQKPYDKEPDQWFHDIFRQNGTHYDTTETDLIRKLTKK